MKNLFKFHFAILLIGYFLLLILFSYTQSKDGRLMGIGLVNAVLGITQLTTFIVMLFSRKNYNIFFFSYFLMSLGFGIYYFSEYGIFHQNYFENSMLMAFFIAHFFVLMLYLTIKKIERAAVKFNSVV